MNEASHSFATAAEADRRQALVASFGARALEEGLSLQDLLTAAAAHAAEGLGVSRAKVLEHRPASNDLLVRAGVGWNRGVVGQATLPDDMASPAGRALQTASAVAIEDIRLAIGFSWSPLLREHGVVAMLNVPVKVPGRPFWGVLEGDSSTRRRFGRAHQHFLQSLASLLGAAIRRLDIESELREARARAEAQAAEHAAILAQLAEGVIVTDAAGRIAFINEAAARIHGMSRLGIGPAEYTDTYSLLNLAGEPYPPEQLPLSRAVLGGETVTEERWRIRRPDGTEVLAAGSARPVLGPDGQRRLGAVLTLRDDTARDAAERALRASEARLRVAQRSARAVTWDWDLLTRTIHWGDLELARTLAGADLEETTSFDQWVTRIHDEDMVDHMQAAAAIVQQGEGRLEYRILHDGRQLRWLEGAGRVVARDETGAPTRLAGVTMDITERRAAEAALRESEARLRALADNLPSGMVFQRSMRQDGSENRLVYASRGCQRLLGLSPDALLADPGAFYAAVVPEDRAALAAAEAAALRDLCAFEIAVRVVRMGDSSIHWAHIVAAPRAVHDGTLMWDGLLVDVTDRRRAEQALREEARTLDLLNRTGALLVAELDLERIAQAVSDAATELSGAALGVFVYGSVNQSQEVVRLCAVSGVPYATFDASRSPAFHAPGLIGGTILRAADIRADTCAGLGDIFAGVVPQQGPMRSYLAVPVAARSGEILGGLFFGHPEVDVFNDRAEGLVRAIAAQAAVAIDNARLYLAAQREITARTAAEADLQRLNETLEQRVAVETLERSKAESALRQAQKMEAIGQLTGGIAHDFNNLLQGVVGSLHMLRRRVAAGRINELDRYVDAALSSADRAAALTHRLLAFARRQPLDPKPIDANLLVASLHELVQRTVGPSIQVETVLADQLWQILCDQHQLENALLNLCINARDAMAEGGHLTIQTTNVTLDGDGRAANDEVAPGEYVELRVQDSGSGMAPDVIARAFDPFFTTKPLGQGTGLGLSMIYGFTQQSNGHASISSELGRGTSVSLFLPRHHGAAALPAVLPAEAALPLAGTGESILLVEDEAVVRNLVVEMLKDEGYAPHEAEDAATALRLLRSGGPVDLLITDVGLPGGMNGRQLADAARELRPGLKILFVTGYAQTAQAGHTLLAEGMELLAKPFALDTLATKIRTILSDGRRG